MDIHVIFASGALSLVLYAYALHGKGTRPMGFAGMLKLSDNGGGDDFRGDVKMWNRNDALTAIALAFLLGGFLGELFPAYEAGVLWTDAAASWTQAIFSVVAIAAAAYLPWRIFRAEQEKAIALERKKGRHLVYSIMVPLKALDTQITTAANWLYANVREHKEGYPYFVYNLRKAVQDVRIPPDIEVPDELVAIDVLPEGLPSEVWGPLAEMIFQIDAYRSARRSILQFVTSVGHGQRQEVLLFGLEEAFDAITEANFEAKQASNLVLEKPVFHVEPPTTRVRSMRSISATRRAADLMRFSR